MTGKPIGHSRSPILHNTGYKLLGLPYEFERFETDDLKQVYENLLSNENFGGCAVTIPLKLDIMEYLSELTPAAKLIGAVNTVTPLGDGKFQGDNTDWKGITESLYRNGIPKINSSKDLYGAIVGGGGTARAAVYALKQMGCLKIYMANRTASKLYEIKSSFPLDFNIEVLESDEQIAQIETISIIVSTVPADKPIDTGLLTKIEVLLSKGVPCSFTPSLLEAAYKPRVTPIMKLANEKYNWNVVPGAEMLVNQGVEQFRKWTGFTAPYDEIYNAVTAD